MHKNQIYLLIIAGLIVLLGYEVFTFNIESHSATTPSTELVMYKNPGCQCCTYWASHMEEAGFSVTENPTDQLASIKNEQGVPYSMSSCHTALIGDYVIEGHVPVEDVRRLLKEQPDARGLAVPGMPAGSPGMESPNPEPYKVYLLENDGRQTVYAQHNSD